MSWLSLVLSGVQVIQLVLQWLAKRDLLDSERAVIANDFLNQALKVLRYANTIRTTYNQLTPKQRDSLQSRYRRKATSDSAGE